MVGGWQLLTSVKIIDPFFFGQPSGIVLKLRDWFQHGTAYGSIWLQIWTTMSEALLGFVFGVAAGVVVRRPARAGAASSPTCSGPTSRS